MTPDAYQSYYRVPLSGLLLLPTASPAHCSCKPVYLTGSVHPLYSVGFRMHILAFMTSTERLSSTIYLKGSKHAPVDTAVRCMSMQFEAHAMLGK